MKDVIAYVKNISKIQWKPHTGLTTSFPVKYVTSMMYEDSISTHYPKSVQIDTATHDYRGECITGSNFC